MAICGPNGAGKSTLLGALAGSSPPDAGRILLNGRTLSSYSPVALARRRAVLSQQSALLFAFQVAEVVMLGRAPHQGISTARDDARIVRAAMAQMGISALAERNYLTLSGGERQRVQLARVLAQIWEPAAPDQARWLLLDEPTAALDLKYQIGLMRVLRQCADNGWAVIAVLHDLALVRRWADRCVLLRQGQLVADGLAGEVLQADQVARVFDLDPADLAGLLPAAEPA